MFDRFTERARDALTIARYEAQGPSGTQLGAEYILLGLLSQDDCGAVRVIARLGVDVRSLRRELVMQIGATTESSLPAERDDALRILELAMKEAGPGRDRYIGTEHLLVAILRGGDSLAATVLKRHEIALDSVRAEMANLVGPDGKIAHSV